LRIAYHQKRLAPFFGACDIHIEVSAPKPEELRDTRSREPSLVVRQRVEQARIWQERRGMTNAAFAQLDRVQEAVILDPLATKLLNAAMCQLHLTPRSLIQTLRLARTIADLAGAETVLANHLAEAIQYRPRIQR